MKRSTILVLGLALLPAVAGAQTLNLSQDLVPLGIDARNLTPNDPELDAGPLLLKGAQYAKNRGLSVVTADPGTYYFLSLQTNDSHVTLTQLNDLTIDFQGSELLLSRTQRRGISIIGCQNTTLQNFTIDFQPQALPFTQVRVTAVDPVARRVSFQVEPAWSHPSVFNTRQNPFGLDETVYVFFFRNGVNAPGLPRLIATRPFTGDDFAILNQNNPWDTSEVLSRIQPEDVAVLTARAAGEPVYADRCDGLTLRNIRVYSSGINGVNAVASAHSLIERVYVMPKPGTDRLISSNADGITLGQPGVGNTIRLSRAIRTADDGFSPHSLAYGSVAATVDARTLRITRQHSIAFPDGVTVTFQRPTDGEILGTAAVVSQNPSGGQPRPQESVEVRFDRDLPALQAGTVLYAADAAERASATILEKNIVQDQIFARGISLWGLINSEVRGNYISGATMSAIFGTHRLMTTDWISPPLQNVSIHHNVIDGAMTKYGNGIQAKMGAIQTLAQQSNAAPMTRAPHRDVQIRNNFIAEASRSAIRIENVTGGIAADNVIVNANKDPFMDGYFEDTFQVYRNEFVMPIVVKSSQSAATSGNTTASAVGRATVTNPDLVPLVAYAPGTLVLLRARDLASRIESVVTVTDADGQTLPMEFQVVSGELVLAQLPPGTGIGGAYITIGGDSNAIRATLFVDTDDNLPARRPGG